jgi:catechol 2,3-dioxygenase-like lactoylglutathione lyase family enzyme
MTDISIHDDRLTTDGVSADESIASPNPRLGHVTLPARDPEVAAGFYRDLLDLRVVRRTSNPLAGNAVLLSGDPVREDHELVFLTNGTGRHIAFRVETVEQLRTVYGRAKRRGIEVPFALDSGIAIGFFVRDPERNAVEIYVAQGTSHRDEPLVSDPGDIERLILGR